MAKLYPSMDIEDWIDKDKPVFVMYEDNETLWKDISKTVAIVVVTRIVMDFLRERYT